MYQKTLFLVEYEAYFGKKKIESDTVEVEELNKYRASKKVIDSVKSRNKKAEVKIITVLGEAWEYGT